MENQRPAELHQKYIRCQKELSKRTDQVTAFFDRMLRRQAEQAGRQIFIDRSLVDLLANHMGDLGPAFEALVAKIEAHPGTDICILFAEDVGSAIEMVAMPSNGEKKGAFKSKRGRKPSMERSRQVLNALESSARTLRESKRVVTGSAIASLMNKTPAAVSDAVRHHRDRIRILLQRHPKEWTIIRNELESIQKILASPLDE